ncbi:MAG: PfkB family carbohydrate kinase [Candidatus Cloacimonadota bacterium]|nr:PfkB family carbohydrate kinase [Candidatus Cloacimonadota bacterium]
MSLLIVGSIALDSVQNRYATKSDILGGSAVYASISARYLHDDVSIVGVVGEDFPEKHRNLLIEKEIDITGLETAEGKTFRWSGRYEDFDEAITLSTDLNVFGNFSPKIPSKLKDADYVLLGNIDPDLQIDVLKQMNNPKVVAADTMNFWIEGKNKELKKMLSMIDILFINEAEVKMLTGERDIFQAAKRTLEIGPKIVVVKQGEHGGFVYRKNFLFFVPVFPVKEVVDTTGAGDCFAGGFMAYLASKDSIEDSVLKEAAVFGTITSSFNIEDFSVDRIKKISKEKIDERYHLMRKHTQF